MHVCVHARAHQLVEYKAFKRPTPGGRQASVADHQEQSVLNTRENAAMKQPEADLSIP